MGGGIIPDGPGDCSNARTLADGDRHCVALPNGRRVCEVRALSWVQTVSLLVYPKVTAAAFYRFKHVFVMGVRQISVGEEQAVLVDNN